MANQGNEKWTMKQLQKLIRNTQDTNYQKPEASG